MSSVILLDKTRKILNLLHDSSSSKVVFDDICLVMSEVTDSNAYVISRKGKILGAFTKADSRLESSLLSDKVGDFIDESLNDRFNSILSTNDNCNLKILGFDMANVHDYKGIVSPIYVAGKRYGTIFICRKDLEYDIDDIILSEYCSTVVGLEMMRSTKGEMEEDDRKKAAVSAALKVMTSAEIKSLYYLFREIKSGEGLIVTSQVADKYGITRSVLVNAIKKMESAGIVEASSAGMRGTRIKLENEFAVPAISEFFGEE